MTGILRRNENIVMPYVSMISMFGIDNNKNVMSYFYYSDIWNKNVISDDYVIRNYIPTFLDRVEI